MEQYKCNDFNKSGTIILPKKWRTKFKLLPGSLVDLEHQGDSIIIKKYEKDSTNNSRILSDKGEITVPVELRNLLAITENDEFCLYVDEKRQCFLLEIVKNPA